MHKKLHCISKMRNIIINKLYCGYLKRTLTVSVMCFFYVTTTYILIKNHSGLNPVFIT